MLGNRHLSLFSASVVDFGLVEVGVWNFSHKHLSKLDGLVEWIVDRIVIHISTTSTRARVEERHFLLLSSVLLVRVNHEVELIGQSVVVSNREHQALGPMGKLANK